MRDYGVVRVRFWEWAKRKKLSSEAREMALYLLTCPHGNSLGCFRLPTAYICDDLGTTEAKVAKTMAALEDVYFVARDHETGWTWIRDYLEHNQIPNGKVGKAVDKILASVPRSAAFYPDLLAALDGEKYIDQSDLGRLVAKYTRTQDTVSAVVEPITQTHDQEQEHNQELEQGRGGALAPSPTAEAVDLFNGAAEQAGWSRVQVLNPARKRALAVCLLAVGGIDGFQSLVAKATASDFLCGRSRRSDEHANWRCDFDFLLKKHIKIMEGSYDNTSSVRPSQSGLGAALAGLAD